MGTLSSSGRGSLEGACVAGRRAAESAVAVALSAIGVSDDRPPAFLNEEGRQLRRGLRAKSRGLGDENGSLDLLISECAYAQWHLLLFARFLEENQLLIHPQFQAPVTLDDCEQLADEMGLPDGWAVAASFAAEILPGIFQLNDPAVQLRLAPEGRIALERIITELPKEVFVADDALGWVYQFWQKDKKDEVNASERKIGGADISPVTQLFTENYMVRFLLENSLGAWWAARFPNSPLLAEWEYLKFDDDGKPAAGTFDGWPDTVAEVTVMDPCCGSGHFLIEAFSMLWHMRAEEEDLNPVAAQDAVLRDNLFGLELDPRCVQIAMFAVALQAWKDGNGWRELPIPNIACSGIPVKTPVEEWTALANGDSKLENALTRLHILFRDADTLGSLIDPKRAVEITDPTGLQTSTEDANWDEVAPLLERLLEQEQNDPTTAVLGTNAAGIARAANYLSQQYTLIATNPPFLGRGGQSAVLRDFCLRRFPDSEAELATVVVDRWGAAGSQAVVLPQNWLFTSTFSSLRKSWLQGSTWKFLCRLGAGAFEAITGEVVQVVLWLRDPTSPQDANYVELSVEEGSQPFEKAVGLKTSISIQIEQCGQLSNPDSVVVAGGALTGPFIGDVAEARSGLTTGDSPAFIRFYWELPEFADSWEKLQSAPNASSKISGCEKAILWENESGRLANFAEAVRGKNTATQGWRRGKPFWGSRGLLVKLMGDLYVNPYFGERFDLSCAVIHPNDPIDVEPLWSYASSGGLEASVRSFHSKLSIESGTLLAAPIDIGHWRSETARDSGFPEPWSDDPTQWLFEGRPEIATEPLQVAVGRLMGFRWPEQPEDDDLDVLADEDGIVCLSPVLGERPAAERLQELLARAYGHTWSPAKTIELLNASGSKKKDLDTWLVDDFFKHHCKVFKNRPFIWHIWDGRKDGFNALVNYHTLDKAKLDRLTYSYLGDWIERQTADTRDEVPGADLRLAAAQSLQEQLALIIEGEAPYDIYVRWKELHEQPLGWNPDINDGVRLNVRPFVEAGVLRNKFNVHWKKDRGKNPDGTERHNDIHHTLEDKRTAQGHTP